ncbi:related to para-nitrobenzyl esterase [Sporisorium reilianum SRZ2]|uniref:Carboxylic ester hydrolase n=1 Tax=Sporisorium reilianum (strain SRZ2) TaxID=999809 RepID=E6ZVN2_SPORE|nr:related to para-nitrobenzyl esterase [Sporisorium reilianum SRZ2]
MTLLSALTCLFCSLVICLNSCAVPVPSCPGNDCIIFTTPSVNPVQVTLHPLGVVVGTTADYAAQRFTLPYARPPVGALRFSSPQPLAPFNTAVYNATQLPKACMQQPDAAYGISQDDVSEDCLYLNVFRPSNGGKGMPVLVWVHGGSFVQGASTAPGLDGSWLATRYNIVVVTIQYRLGMFGFFSPSGFTDESATASSKVQGNQGIRDAVQALQFIHDNIGAFGGDPNRVTLAGQSSGAHLIRSLLNAPSAASLFHRAILHSDPANFGTQTLSTSQEVSDYALSQTNCSDLQCLRAMTAADLLSTSTATMQAGQSIDSSVAAGEVWRPFIGQLTGAAFEGNPSAASTSKPIIFTNVENEGGSVVGTMLLPTGTNASTAELQAYPVTMTRAQLLSQMFNSGRGESLANATQYGMDTNTSAYPSPARIELFSQSNDSLRRNLEAVLTQGMFICPTWFNAQRYTSRAPAYVALFEKGMRYPSNANNDYCTQDGGVCHEDDIQLVFADPSKVADAATRKVAKEVQARWAAFATNGDPNTGKYGGWSSVGTSAQSARVLRLGASASRSSAADTISLQTAQYAGCGQVWHSEVKFDWQLYG